MSDLQKAARDFDNFISDFNNRMAEISLKDIKIKKQLAECKKLLLTLLEEHNEDKNGN